MSKPANPIILYQPPGAWGLRSLSPFCVKLESYLRMAEIPYKVERADIRKSPKGKIPYIDAGGGHLMADSQLIIEHLKRTHGDPLDRYLSPEEVALGHVVRRTLEEGTYWILVHERWMVETGWQQWLPGLKLSMPPVVGSIIIPMIRRRVSRTLHGQGTGRHSRDEIQEIGKADITAIATLLGDKPFLLGDKPTSFDATVFAFVTAITLFPADSPVKQHTLAQANLVRYTEQFQERFFGGSANTE